MILIYEEVLNHMDSDEIKNLVCHLIKIDEIRGDLVAANSELIDDYKHLVNDYEYRQNILSKLNVKEGNYTDFVHQMFEKYDEFIPRPVCDTPQEVRE